MQNDFRKRMLFDDNLMGVLRDKLSEEDLTKFKLYITKLPYETLLEVMKSLMNSKCIQKRGITNSNKYN